MAIKIRFIIRFTLALPSLKVRRFLQVFPFKLSPSLSLFLFLFLFSLPFLLPYLYNTFLSIDKNVLQPNEGAARI